jgi:pyruvate/2-oxoglutarate/acetoin dehydrogenase E1 component
MREIYGVQALREAVTEEMSRDPRVIYLGEDIKIPPLGIEKGLFERFGPTRVWNSPISESAVVGSAIGAAATGLRPIMQLHTSSFVYVAMDQLYNQAAKLRYMVGGQFALPVVFHMACGALGSAGAHHSDTGYGLFMSAPGIKVVVPSNPYDAKGLLKAAIRDDNPVMFYRPLSVLRERADVPEDEYVIPIGSATVKRSGDDVTILAVGSAVGMAVAAAESATGCGISAEVVDVRTLRPFDEKTVFDSVAKTGRLVIVDEDRQPSFAAEVAALVSEKLFDALTAPIVRITTATVPIPFSPPLEAAVLPNGLNIEAALDRLARGE